MASSTTETVDMSEIEKAIETIMDSQSASTDLKNVIATLAKASRSVVDVRFKLGNSDILERLIELAQTSLKDSPSTVNVALRCIGNSCIDNDAAREAITNVGFSWAKACLEQSDVEIRTLTVLVLVNICMDYEPAQKRCYQENIHHPLISIVELAASYGDDNDRHYPIELLFWITNQKGAAPETPNEDEEPLTAAMLTKLISLPYNHRRGSGNDGNPDDAGTDDDDFAIIIETVVTYLRDTLIQTKIVELTLVNYVWQMLLLNEARISALPLNDEDTKALLIPMSTNLTWCLSDIAANADFSKRYQATSDGVAGSRDLITLVEQTISESAGIDHAGRQSPSLSMTRTANAACQVLGNFLWALDPESSSPYVTEKKIHTALWLLLSTSDNADLLHSVACLLIQLTRPSVEVREIVGSSDDAEAALGKLCRHDTPQLKQDGIKLLRSLGKECAINQQRFSAIAQEVMQTPADSNVSEVTSTGPAMLTASS